jgi:hypothetical protein
MSHHDPISRRRFVGGALLATAASVVLPAHGFLDSRGWLEAAQSPPPDLLHDTFNGLFAFVVPGPDAYSVAQGMSTTDLGGVDSGAVDHFIATLDQSTPFVPGFSATVATVLNGLAQVVNASPQGPFTSPFARLSSVEKSYVFQIIDATDSLKLLGGLLPLFVAFFTYSEAGAFDPVTRSLTGQPVGWRISGYQGVSDGRDEFLGYFRNRREV